MALSDWITKSDSGAFATATPATPATDRPKKRGSVANVATVAVAEHQNQNAEAFEPVDYDAEITAVIHEFDEAGIIVPEVPVEIRREALALEDEITAACNAGDVPRFREALHAWRAAWMRSLH